MRKTKIICTYGPAVASREMVEKLIRAGANVFRFNFSHGDYDYHTQGMNYVKEVREELGYPVAILLDTKGPEIRTGLQDEEFVMLETDSEVTLFSHEGKSRPGHIHIDYHNFANEIPLGTSILFDDGKLKVEVLRKIDGSNLLCKVIQGGEIRARRSVNTPSVTIKLPFLSEKDKADLVFGSEIGVDLVAASFTRDAEDIKAMRRHLFLQNEFTCDIVAKIENHEGVENIEEICFVADGIMVARGDLGVELPVEDVPYAQKKIIRTCRHYGKPVITATQMLESMISNMRPTRAEVSDIANAIYDSTSAIMLSGETATGEYPVECVEMMNIIAKRTEKDLDYDGLLRETMPKSLEGTKAMANAALSTAYDLNAHAIVSLTSSGYSARLISRRRPKVDLIAPTNSWRTFYKMALYWGVRPLYVDVAAKVLGEVFEEITDKINEQKILPKGSLIILLGGSPVGISGSTNVLRISSIGNVATRGHALVKGNTNGLVHIYKNKKTTPEGRILVMRYLMETDLNVLKTAKALILQGEKGEDYAKVAGETLNIPVITRAEGVVSTLYENEMVYINGEEGIVYRKPNDSDKGEA